MAKRRVFYIPGYDPFPPRRYRELYRKESRKQALLSGYQIEQKPGSSDTGWLVRSRIEGGKTLSRIDVLVWSDLVRSSMSTGIIGTYFSLAKTSWTYFSTGTFRRLTWLRKGPVIAALYPVVMLLAQLMAALLVAGIATGTLEWGASLIAGFVGASVSGVAATMLSVVSWGLFLGFAYLILKWFKSLDGKTFAYYLMNDFAYTASKNGAYPDEIEARLHEFRHRIEAALRDEDVDEVLIVGHSSGAHMAVSVVADILRNQELGHEGPALSLLTLGQAIPMVSFLPDAKRLRRDLHDVSVSDQVAWLDVSAPGDGCSFALTDPVSVSGVAPGKGQRWPIIMSAAFSNTLSDELRESMKWRFFRLHFQYLCAFDQPGDYDYFKITAGPTTLKARFGERQSSGQRIDVVASKFTSMVA